MLKKLCVAFLVALGLFSTAWGAEEEALRQKTVQNFRLSYPAATATHGEAAVKIDKDLAKEIDRFMKPYLGTEDVEGCVDGHVAYEDEKYLAIELDCSYYFKGAAHPSHVARGLVYDKSDGKRLQAERFCRLPKAKELETELRRGSVPLLNGSGEAIALPDFMTVEKISKDFIIDGDSVKLVYSPYELAPYAMGTTYVVLPRSK